MLVLWFSGIQVSIYQLVSDLSANAHCYSLRLQKSTLSSGAPWTVLATFHVIMPLCLWSFLVMLNMEGKFRPIYQWLCTV